MANNTVCRGRQTAFLPRLKPGVSCLFLMKTEHEVFGTSINHDTPKITE